jgi:hypothetical protein
MASSPVCENSSIATNRLSAESVASQTHREISLLSNPLLIIYHFTNYLTDLISHYTLSMISKHLLSIIIFIAASAVLAMELLIWNRFVSGETVEYWWIEVCWYGWWVSLGIASSIGLGTGLHTFFLFLSPFIVQSNIVFYFLATITGNTCQSLLFATHGVSQFICITHSSVEYYILFNN